MENKPSGDAPAFGTDAAAGGISWMNGKHRSRAVKPDRMKIRNAGGGESPADVEKDFGIRSFTLRQDAGNAFDV
ncbi:hypothetical protein JW906_04385 [bacterium]|nr:hypothetical protein [bacterium]